MGLLTMLQTISIDFEDKNIVSCNNVHNYGTLLTVNDNRSIEKNELRGYLP